MSGGEGVNTFWPDCGEMCVLYRTISQLILNNDLMMECFVNPWSSEYV